MAPQPKQLLSQTADLSNILVLEYLKKKRERSFLLIQKSKALTQLFSLRKHYKSDWSLWHSYGNESRRGKISVNICLYVPLSVFVCVHAWKHWKKWIRYIFIVHCPVGWDCWLCRIYKWWVGTHKWEGVSSWCNG